MRIDVFLNRSAENAPNIRAQLDSELQALRQPKVDISSRTTDVESGELGFAEVYQFIVDNRSDILAPLQLLTVILQLSNAVLARHGMKRSKVSKPRKRRSKTGTTSNRRKPDDDKTSPALVVAIEGDRIELPASDSQVKRFLHKVDSKLGTTPKRSPPKKSPPKSRTRRSTGSR
jgi:hypothetical protein